MAHRVLTKKLFLAAALGCIFICATTAVAQAQLVTVVMRNHTARPMVLYQVFLLDVMPPKRIEPGKSAQVLVEVTNNTEGFLLYHPAETHIFNYWKLGIEKGSAKLTVEVSPQGPADERVKVFHDDSVARFQSVDVWPVEGSSRAVAAQSEPAIARARSESMPTSQAVVESTASRPDRCSRDGKTTTSSPLQPSGTVTPSASGYGLGEPIKQRTSAHQSTVDSRCSDGRAQRPYARSASCRELTRAGEPVAQFNKAKDSSGARRAPTSLPVSSLTSPRSDAELATTSIRLTLRSESCSPHGPTSPVHPNSVQSSASTPRSGSSTPRAVVPTPRSGSSTPHAVIPTPRSGSSTPHAVATTLRSGSNAGAASPRSGANSPHVALTQQRPEPPPLASPKSSAPSSAPESPHALASPTAQRAKRADGALGSPRRASVKWVDDHLSRSADFIGSIEIDSCAVSPDKSSPGRSPRSPGVIARVRDRDRIVRDSGE